MNSTANQSSDDFGIGIPLNIPFRVFIVILDVTCMIFGGPGNIAIVLIILSKKDLRQPINYFIINLAIADAIFCLFITPVDIGDLIMGRFPLSKAWCGYIAAFSEMIVIVSFQCVAMIGLSRYLKVCKTTVYDKCMGRKSSIVLNLSIWLFGFLFEMYFVFTGSISYNKFSHICETGGDHLAYMSFCLFVLTIYTCLFLCYWKIWMTMKQSRSVVRNSRSVDNSQTINHKDECSIISIFLVFIFYVTLTLPLIIIWLFLPNLSPELMILANSFIFVNCSINWILYGAMNKTFQRTSPILALVFGKINKVKASRNGIASVSSVVSGAEGDSLKITEM